MTSAFGLMAYTYFLGLNLIWCGDMAFTDEPILGPILFLVNVLSLSLVMRNVLRYEAQEREFEEMREEQLLVLKALEDIGDLFLKLHALETVKHWRKLEGFEDEPARIE